MILMCHHDMGRIQSVTETVIHFSNGSHHLGQDADNSYAHQTFEHRLTISFYIDMLGTLETGAYSFCYRLSLILLAFASL